MNKFKLFLKEDCFGRLGKGGEYSYEDGVLEINWYGERSWHYLKPGAAVLVTLSEGEAKIRSLQAPKTYPAKLLWLCGVPRVARCKSLAEYDTMVEGHKDSPVQHLGGEGWQIAKGISINFHPLAGGSVLIGVSCATGYGTINQTRTYTAQERADMTAEDMDAAVCSMAKMCLTAAGKL